MEQFGDELSGDGNFGDGTSAINISAKGDNSVIMGITAKGIS